MPLPAARPLAAALLSLALAASVAAQPVPADGPASGPTDAERRAVAVVDGVPISEARFLDSYARRLMTTGAADTPAGRAAHLRRLVEAALLADEGRRLGLADGAAFTAEADRIARHVTGGEWYKERVLDGLGEPTQAELEAAFALGAERVVLRHLFFRTRDQAASAAAALAAGRDFVDLANEVFAPDVPTVEAGLLGEVGYWDLDDAVAQAAFGLDVGAVSAPVRSRYGWHLLRVEGRTRQAVLTEAAFQQARGGLANRVRARRERVEGAAFVRAFMEAQDVRPERAAVEALAAAMARYRGDDRRGPLSEAEASEIAASLDPGAVLATYGPPDGRLAFTVGDYLFWLRALPPSEALGRTGASVGRAVRNEALALAGEAAGLDRTPGVLEEVRHRQNGLLADEMARLVREYRADGDVDWLPVALTVNPLDEWAHLLHPPTEAEVREGFERLGYAGAPAAVRVDAWVFEAASYDGAARALADGTWRGAARIFEDAEVAALGVVAGHARTAPLGDAAVVGTADAWYVVRVDRREAVPVQFEDVEGEVRERLAATLPQARLLRALRARAEVSVDAASPALVPPSASGPSASGPSASGPSASEMTGVR